jgi:ElaB/YqjD/DUF883 family membrane-anchored ribosome-binding protein
MFMIVLLLPYRSLRRRAAPSACSSLNSLESVRLQAGFRIAALVVRLGAAVFRHPEGPNPEHCATRGVVDGERGPWVGPRATSRKPESGGKQSMKRGKKAMRGGADAIRDELANIESEVASLGRSLGGAASAEAKAALSSIRERLERIADDAGSMTRAGVDAVEETIEDNPFTSLAIAFGLGLVLAFMIRR